MTKPPIPKDDTERLSQEEVTALAVWLAETGRLGERPADAVTVADIAEAFGVDRDEVTRHLRQMRAERSFVAAPAKPKSQAGLLGLAVAMFVVAGLVYRLRPHKMTEAEMDAIVSDLKARPHRIHYPIEKKVDLGAAAPPAGFKLELDGDYVIVTAQPHDTKLLDAADAEAQLTKSFEALAVAAQELEQDTPVPPAGTKLNPPGVRAGQSVNSAIPGQIFVNGRWVRALGQPVGSGKYLVQGLDLPSPTSLDVSSPPPPGYTRAIVDGAYGIEIAAPPADSAGLATWRADLAAKVRFGVDGKLHQQNGGFEFLNKPQPDQWATAPPGFSFQYQGQSTSIYRGSEAALLPLEVDPSVKMLSNAVRFAIRKDRELMASFPRPRAVRVAQEKRPVIPFAKISLNCPDDVQVEYNIPIERSKQFPTAADVVRGQEAMLAEIARRTKKQLTDIDAGREPSR